MRETLNINKCIRNFETLIADHDYFMVVRKCLK